MNENQNFEFITAILWELANSNYVESLSPSDKSISISNSNNLKIEIKQVNKKAEVTAKNERSKESILIPLSSLTSLFERIGMLDEKLESKLNFVFNHKTYMKKPEAIKLTIEFMIDSRFPELKESVKVQIGGDRDEVLLLLENGLHDPSFKNAFPALILRKSFFENCKMFGVKKLVFIDELNNTFDDIVIDNYDIDTLK